MNFIKNIFCLTLTTLVRAQTFKLLATAFFTFCFWANAGVISPTCESGFSKEQIEALKRSVDPEDAWTQVKLGFKYEKEGKPEDSHEWIERAAENGNAVALHTLGFYSKHGYGTNIDPKKSLKFFKQAAARGYAPAETNVGLWYKYGSGELIKQDFNEAFEWFEQAAEQGYAKAQYYVGLAYLYGEGVDRDHTEAKKWFGLAAEQGYAYAQFRMSTIEKKEKNYIEAYMWVQLSRAQEKTKNTERVFNFLKKHMAEKQIKKAEKRVKDFKPKDPKPISNT